MKKTLSIIVLVALIFGLGFSLTLYNSVPKTTVQTAVKEPESQAVTDVPTQAAEEKSQPVRSKDIVIICTNDAHSHISDSLGYAGVSQLKKNLLAEGKDVILVDAGDFVHGTTYGSMSLGEIPVNIMNELGYDVATLGNHEFDYGFSVLKELEETANFPFVAMNIYDTATNSLIFKPYTIIEKDGLKIGFIGIATPISMTRGDSSLFTDLNGNVLYDFLQDESGEKLWKAVQTTVDEVRSQGVDYVIAVSHLGNSTSFAPYLSTTCIENVSGVDAYIDGHSHTIIDGESVKDVSGKKVLLTQAGSNLKEIGLLTINTEGKFSYKLIDNIDPDPEMQEFITKQCEEIDNTLNIEFTEVTQDLTDRDPATGMWMSYQVDCNIGELCNDAIRYYTKADINVLNAGSIRNALSKGKITYKDVLDVFPFNNSIVIIEIDGQHILDMLEISVSKSPEEYSEFLHVSGLTFKYTTNVSSPVTFDNEGNAAVSQDGNRRVKEVLINGTPLERDKKYTLSSASYTLFNDKAYKNLLSDCTVVDPFFAIDYDLLVCYLRDVYPTLSSNYDNPYGTERIVVEN